MVMRQQRHTAGELMPTGRIEGLCHRQMAPTHSEWMYVSTDPRLTVVVAPGALHA